MMNNEENSGKEYMLPFQKVEKLMKAALVSGKKGDGRVDKQAVEIMQEYVTEFICFVTADMCEQVAREKRVALKGQDLVESLNNLGFAHYSDVLEQMLHKLT